LPYTSRLTLGMHYASVHFSSVCIVLYKCSIVSFRTAPGAARQSFVHRMAWPAGEKKESSLPLPPSISYKSPLPIRHAKRLESHTCAHVYPVFAQCQKERARASQPTNMQIPPIHRTHIPNPIPIIFLFLFHNPIPFSFDCDSNLLLTSHQHPSAHASSTACSSCSTPPCTSPCSWIRLKTTRSRGSGCSGRSSVR
jgi:hypothetical protein